MAGGQPQGVSGITHVGHHRATPGFLACGLLLAVIFGYPAVLALYPQTYEAVFDRGVVGTLMRQAPRPLVTLVFGGAAIWFAWAFWSAVLTKRPVIVMTNEGVTCYRLVGRGRTFPWADIARVEKRGWGELRFLGGSSEQWLLGGCMLVGQDHDAIRAVIGHHRPDLADPLGPQLRRPGVLLHFTYRLLFTLGLSAGMCFAFLAAVKYSDARDRCAGSQCAEALRSALMEGGAASFAAVASLVGLFFLAVRPVSPR